MAPVAFATTSSLAHHDLDRPLIDAAAGRLGIDAVWVSWDDRAVDWSAFERVVIHSTWDYHHRIDEFIDWIDRVDAVTTLVNPGQVVRWNHHKRYLLELEGAGVAIVPTVLLSSANAAEIPIEWPEVIVKPAVSAGAKATARATWGTDDSVEAVRAIAETDDVLIQPVIREVAEVGETSIVMAGGEVVHAVRKRPAEGDFRVQEQFGGSEAPVAPTEPERQLVDDIERALVSLELETSYARVDCVTVGDDALLMELELIEPALYLWHAPERVADAFVRAVVEVP